MKRFLYHWAPVIFYTALIFVFSSFALTVPKGSDKIIHILEYALLGFFMTRALLLTWNISKGWGIFLGTLATAVLGALDEFHQLFVPGRSSTVGDGLADLGGALLGSLLFIYLGTWLYRSKKLYERPKAKCY